MRSDEFISENLKQWFKEKWVRFGPDGKIRGDCARGSEGEGKPKCLPQSKAQALGKKGRASAAAKKRREDPNPERRGPAKNVATKVKEQGVAEGHADQQRKIFKKNGKPVGEVGIDRESSPGVGQYYMKHYASGKDLAGYDSYEEAVAELKHFMKQGLAEDDLDEACWKGYHKEGMKTMFGKRYPNCVKNKNESLEVYVNRGECPGCGGVMVSEDQINEKQDACYHKVKSRYKVWPSAYASGALVQCRKKGAANWGNKSESTEQELDEKWSKKYKSSINCANPKGFSQKAHCASKNKNESQENMMDELDRIVELSTGMSASERAELAEEFDLIESNIDMLAEHNAVDAEVIWEDLESLTDDELYVFAVTQPVMEDWQKANKKDRTAGMSQKAVNAYRRENPGSKLKTAVTTKPSKLKKGSKASKRRKSYCSRSRGQMKMHNISCAKTPDKAICKARRRWNCE